MALFLQESIEPNLNDNISIEEAYEGLIEASMDMQELTESLLQADFIIHEQCKVLTEAEADTKKVNFLIKTVQHIKDFIVKLGKQIRNFIIKIAQYAKYSWDALLAKLNIVREIEVPVGFSSLAQTISSTLSRSEKSALDKNVDKKQLENNDGKIKQLLNKFSILSKNKKGQTEKVSATKLEPVFKYLAKDITNTGIVNSSAIQETEVKVLEKELADSKHKLETSPNDKQQEKNIDDISKKINAINTKNKCNIKLSKTIGTFAKLFVVGLGIVSVAKATSAVNTRNSDEKYKLWDEQRKREFKDESDRMDAEFEKDRARMDAEFDRRDKIEDDKMAHRKFIDKRSEELRREK